MTPTITELGYLGFEVSNLPRWERFATEVLGLGLEAGPMATCRLRMDAAPARFILHAGAADDFAYAGWRVSSTSDLEAFARHLDAQGVPARWGNDAELDVRHAERMLHFTDPEGNRHEVYVARASALTACPSPLVPSGFVTGAGGVGHVVFEASDYPATTEFARRVLGVRLSDHIHLEPAPGVKIEVSFFHANERHHSLAVAPRSPMPGAKKRIHHFMIEMGSMADVGRARDRCLEFGLPVVMDLGQHPNDRMVSFYGHSPSGFLFECGWGGVKVDDATWQPDAYDRVSNWGHRPYGAMPGTVPGIPAAVVEVA